MRTRREAGTRSEVGRGGECETGMTGAIGTPKPDRASLWDDDESVAASERQTIGMFDHILRSEG
ncbi:hypothetical protein BD626DRAFT_504694, partial [Schizophyllum amplum]